MGLRREKMASGLPEKSAGFKLVMGDWLTLVLARISLKSNPCAHPDCQKSENITRRPQVLLAVCVWFPQQISGLPSAGVESLCSLLLTSFALPVLLLADVSGA